MKKVIRIKKEQWLAAGRQAGWVKDKVVLAQSASTPNPGPSASTPNPSAPASVPSPAPVNQPAPTPQNQMPDPTTTTRALPIMRQIANLFPPLKQFLQSSQKRAFLFQFLDALSQNPNKLLQIRTSLAQLQKLEAENAQGVDQAATSI